MQILHQISKDFEAYLSKQHIENGPVGLYGPINYILNIGGKRIRPVVLLLSCYLFKGKYQNALPAAFAVEVFHNFTLVHDDIMDQATKRRGQQTVHHKFGLNAGILSGDAMLVLAYKYLIENTEPAIMQKVLKVFSKFAIEVCEGQQFDMDFEKRELVLINEYLRMIELKTSVLLAGAMEIGALLGGASDNDAANMYEFGRNIGIAFQLQDDILDTYGDPEKFGKKVGGDIAQNKKTILFLKALELAGPTQKETLKSLYRSKEVDESLKIQSVIGIFNQLDVKSNAEVLQERYKSEAFRNLDLVEIPEEKKELVKLFAHNLMIREV